jgi:hypothetical protein
MRMKNDGNAGVKKGLKSRVIKSFGVCKVRRISVPRIVAWLRYRNVKSD